MERHSVGSDSSPLFILHKASPEKYDRKSGRRKMDIAPVNYQNIDADECGDFLRQQLQREAFEIVWSKIEMTIKAVLKNINSDAFNKIHSWVLESFQAIKSIRSPSLCEATSSFPIAITPASKHLFTGLVLTRNMEYVDDLMTFEDLAQHLKSRGCHVANLSSLEFSDDNGISGCIRSLLRQLLSASVDAADICTLSSWYYANSNRDTPVVVIINDVERCCGSVLSTFIVMLSEWVVKIPIILIIGVATTLDVPEKLLHINAMQSLCFCKFTLPAPVDRMDAVIEAVLVKKCSGFVVSHKVAVLMKNYFTSQDGTLSSFIRVLKIACVQHFSAQPLSCMLRWFDGKEIECFQGDNSVLVREVTSKYSWVVASCWRLDEKGGQSLVNALIELKRLQDYWSVAFMCLYEAAKCTQIHLLDLMCEALDPDSHSSRLSDSHSILRRNRFVTQAIQIVRDLPESLFINLLKRWEIHAATIDEIHDKVKELQYALKFENVKRRKVEPPNMPKMHVIQNNSSVRKGAKEVNERAASFIECLINGFMRPMECASFHEITCFENVEKLKEALAGDPRRQVQVDLSGSIRTLLCSCCRSGNILSPSMHDTSIMYTLSQEHGDVINIYDWYQTFKLIVQPVNKGKPRLKQSVGSKRTKDSDNGEKLSEVAIQARFCRAVTELQVTGLLRMQSKKRPDYLQRVVY